MQLRKTRDLLCAVVTLMMASALGCSADSRAPGAGGSVSCRQKAGADTDSDCAGREGGRTRKLDCDSKAQSDEAIAAGCVAEKAGGNDVCCPTSVSGKTEVQLAGCTEPVDTLTDSDCAGTAQGRKLDCTTSAQQKAAIELGCRAESPGSATDFDVCCPTHVRQGEASPSQCTTNYSGSWGLSGSCPETSCTVAQSTCNLSIVCTAGTSLSGTITGTTASLTGKSGTTSLSCTVTFSGTTSFSLACGVCSGIGTKK